jgi:F420H(2)-dependent quinone reductase
MAHLFTRLHARAFRRSGGRIGGHVGGQPVLLLTTRGRRSGTARTTPVQHLADDGRWLVVAAAGGAPRPPAWSLNLAADPRAEIDLGGERVAVTARTLAGAERERAWTLLLAANPRIATAQAKAGRTLDVIELARRRTG